MACAALISVSWNVLGIKFVLKTERHSKASLCQSLQKIQDLNFEN